MNVTFTRAGVAAGFRSTLPVALPVGAFGAVFGLLAQQAGVSALEATLLNLFVFAGAAQIAVLPYWDFPLPVLVIATTTFMINLRLVLVTASLRPWLRHLPNKFVYPLLHYVSDVSWSIATIRYRLGERDAGVVLGSNLVTIAAWFPATLLGFALGDRIPDPERFGLDFAFTAVFGAMLFAGYRSKRDLGPWLASAVVATVMWWLVPGTWYVVAGGIAGVVIAILTAGPANHAPVADVEAVE